MQTSRRGLLQYELQFIWVIFLIKMEEIYRPEPEAGYYPVILCNTRDYDQMTTVNFGETMKSWKPLEFKFYDDGKNPKDEPDIAVAVPTVVIRKELAEELFIKESACVELLPIFISGQPWVMVNCLVSTSKMDLSKSVYCRAPSGVIFMITNLVVNDQSLKNALLFTVDGSNRSTAFMLDRSVKKIKAMKMRGLKFRAVGTLE